MRDKFKGKQLDYRKSWRSCRGFSLEKHFERLYPDCHWRNWRYKMSWMESWQWWYNKEREWVTQKIGTNAVHEGRGFGSINSWFRKSRNRMYRAKQKQMLQKALQNDALDDLYLPRHRRDIRWLYW